METDRPTPILDSLLAELSPTDYPEAAVRSSRNQILSKGVACVNLDQGRAVFWPNDEGVFDTVLSEANGLFVNSSDDYFIEGIRRCSTGANHFECNIRLFE